ncbi:uncharacterized protein TRIVIDRAFT_193320 [Trichoderma virens Gv29-8]|uniref:FAD dependent oxidoreductase domain-containing protein n=1 Tax=Hypocrea virens (strain Gv29-8 / FGSC 10586) TaxID=413071 RepID=G9N0S0_HYPVG|nr:uncharacterized protein TRIVIDRAFT_193320 [Trichoderma virens Gv29-8]EHK19952.1 hypothetical protein TRIVIDRAFT_193320 [Trichoderma virens Gv29-8]UKZ53328.1 hypothetical protein TrVGV298_007120 [Trichoderma virens]
MDLFDVVVIGGGPVGLATAYEIAKTNSKVIVLEQNNFFNQAGSSNDLARMYTEEFMADLAVEAMGYWDDLERDAGVSLRWMSGLLNFGDRDVGKDTPEGTLLGPIVHLNRLEMAYNILTAEEIQRRYPFKNLPDKWIGVFAPDNGIINVPLLLRSLLTLAKHYSAQARQHTEVKSIVPDDHDSSKWKVKAVSHGKDEVVFLTKKIVITAGAYVNHILQPSFGITLDLDIWEMVASYFNSNAGPNGTVFPSMWFQFAPDHEDRSRLFYGFPTVPWGPPNLVRIAIDAATRRIKDPDDRQTNVINPRDIQDTQNFVRDHVKGVDCTVPAYTLTCLQTNVFDNMFVLDFIPEEYLRGGRENSVVVFTAGWAMKFVPLLGKALAELALNGRSRYAMEEFSITRKNPATGKGIIQHSLGRFSAAQSSFSVDSQGRGSSLRGYSNT